MAWHKLREEQTHILVRPTAVPKPKLPSKPFNVKTVPKVPTKRDKVLAIPPRPVRIQPPRATKVAVPVAGPAAGFHPDHNNAHSSVAGKRPLSDISSDEEETYKVQRPSKKPVKVLWYRVPKVKNPTSSPEEVV